MRWRNAVTLQEAATPPRQFVIPSPPSYVTSISAAGLVCPDGDKNLPLHFCIKFGPFLHISVSSSTPAICIRWRLIGLNCHPKFGNYFGNATSHPFLYLLTNLLPFIHFPSSLFPPLSPIKQFFLLSSKTRLNHHNIRPTLILLPFIPPSSSAVPRRLYASSPN